MKYVSSCTADIFINKEGSIVEQKYLKTLDLHFRLEDSICHSNVCYLEHLSNLLSSVKLRRLWIIKPFPLSVNLQEEDE